MQDKVCRDIVQTFTFTGKSTFTVQETEQSVFWLVLQTLLLYLYFTAVQSFLNFFG